jgi:hypothetical protein
MKTRSCFSVQREILEHGQFTFFEVTISVFKSVAILLKLSVDKIYIDECTLYWIHIGNCTVYAKLSLLRDVLFKREPETIVASCFTESELRIKTMNYRKTYLLLNSCWPSPAQWFLVRNPTGFMAIFYSLTALGDFRTLWEENDASIQSSLPRERVYWAVT